jgi:IS30 family transposase
MSYTHLTHQERGDISLLKGEASGREIVHRLGRSCRRIR